MCVSVGFCPPPAEGDVVFNMILLGSLQYTHLGCVQGWKQVFYLYCFCRLWCAPYTYLMYSWMSAWPTTFAKMYSAKKLYTIFHFISSVSTTISVLTCCLIVWQMWDILLKSELKIWQKLKLSLHNALWFIWFTYTIFHKFRITYLLFSFSRF